MTETNEQMTLRALSEMQLAYRKDLDKEHLLFYVKKLSDVDPSILAKAVTKIINTKEFLPSIAELRKTSIDIERDLNGTQDKDVDQAWREVQQAVSRYFVYEKPVFSSPAIADAVKGMGWLSLCNMLTTEVGMFRAQFRDFYLAAVKRHENDDMNARLGVYELAETSNRKLENGSDLKQIGQIMAYDERTESND